MSVHGAMTWTGFILLNFRSVAEHYDQCSEAFGPRNGGVMSQTSINISRRKSDVSLTVDH
jgi:hypothetical protein